MTDEQFQELKDLQQELIDKVSDTNKILMKLIEYQIYGMDVELNTYSFAVKDLKKLTNRFDYIPGPDLVD